MALREKLEQSLAALKEYFDPSRQTESLSNPAQLVLFAEHAVKHGHMDISKECLQLFFSLAPPTNQFLIRAYLCYAVAVAPSSPAHGEKLHEALDHIVKAVDIAKKSECYHFLVYNASVLLWQLCRPFQRPGSRSLYSKALQTVVRALEEEKEQDYPWRLELLLGLVRSQMEGGQREEATKTSSSAAHMARKHVPSRIVDVLKLQAYYQLGDTKVMEKELRASPELMVLSRLYKIKSTLQNQTFGREDPTQMLRKIFAHITGTPAGEEPSTPRRTSSTMLLPIPAPAARPGLLLELACVCVENRLTTLAQDCISALPQSMSQGSEEGGREWVGEQARLELLREFVLCQLMVQQLGEMEESFARSAVEIRLKAIERMQEALNSALRLDIPEITQHACVVLWNLSLPLLQRSLSHHLVKPLTAVAGALEDISSLLHSLRCSVHMELAGITADRNQLQTALEHLQKASSLDHGGEYREQLEHLQHRLLLRAQLYQSPETPEDSAAQIIEQVSSSLGPLGRSRGGGGGAELRSLLVKAGDLLAPDCFVHTLARPTEEAGGGGGGLQSQANNGSFLDFHDKGRRRGDYNLAKEQVDEHAKEVEQNREKERCRLWADLAKTARKQEVWDVALAAAKFCLLYDDGRWTLPDPQHELQKADSKVHQLTHTERLSSPHLDRQRSSLKHGGKGGGGTPLAGGSIAKREGSKGRSVRELLRTLAEVHCLHAECLVYQLQRDGLNLGDTPHSPAHPATPGSGTKEDFGELWQAYCEWVSMISSDAHKSFLRAAELGCSLGEAWLVANVTTYLWNYSHRAVEQGRLRGLVDVFRPLLASVKQVQLQTDPVLVCRVCTVLAGGLVQKWMPSTDPSTSSAKPAPGGGKKGAARQESRMGGKKGKGGVGDGQLHVDPEAGPELKEALEVCEYGVRMNTAGVPVSTRGGLLATWVQCKQLLQQPIPAKTYGIEDDAKDPTVSQCRCVVAVEMIIRMGNRIWDFPSCPTLQEVMSMVSDCAWGEVHLEVELWTRMAGVALRQSEYEMVCQFATRALEAGDRKLSEEAAERKPKTKGSPSQRVEKELLSVSSSLLGQSLAARATGNTAMVRRALESFLTSARYGHQAHSYTHVLDACRHYWNTCLTLVESGAAERQLLQGPLSELLSLIAAFSQKKRKAKSTVSGSSGSPLISGDRPEHNSVQSQQDHRLQVAMYEVVFLAYADKGQWEEGLKAIEDAIWVTPRAIHRDLAQQKVVFKSKMGKNVEGDMVRFQEEPEEFIASLWCKAAGSATDPHQQLKAYQNAIDTLQSPAHTWQKVEYLLEFSEWLYVHQFPPQDALDQLQWATHMLIHMPTAQRDEVGEESLPSASKVSTDPSVLTDVGQLEALMRVQVMMAQLCRRGCQDYQTFCLSALGYCYYIWKQTFASFGKSDGGKTAAQLPETVEQWAHFAVTDELKEFIQGSADTGTLSRQSITKPTLTAYYLQVLSDQLAGLSLHPLTLPTLTLHLALAEGLIGSRPLTQLTHMRIASTCLAMGLEKAAEAHREKAGPDILNPDDVAKSHSEIEQHKAKQELVERETSKLSASASTHPLPPDSKTGKLLVSSGSSGGRLPRRSEHQVSDEVVLREVWVQEAWLLIKEGQYQSAYDLLQETHLSAKMFGDSRIMVETLLGLASLSLTEKDSSKATNLILEAQSYPSTLNHWLEGILLLCGSSSMTGSFSQPQHQSAGLGVCVEVLESALQLVGALGEGQRNETERVGHAEAILKARLVACKVQMLSKDSDDAERSLPRNAILQQCDVLVQSVRKLLELGYQAEAAQVLVQQASIIRSLGLASATSEHHHEDLLQALALYEQAAGVLQSVFGNATTLCHSSEAVSLPVQRELVVVQLCVSEMLMGIFAERSTQARQSRTTVQQKSSVEKMIDEYVREKPLLTTTEEEWENTASVAVEKALAVLTSAHNLSGTCKQLRAKCLYASGHALHLHSEHTSPDPPLHWTYQGGSGSGNMSLGGGGHYSTLSTVMRKEEANQAELEEESSLGAITQACQCLAQAASLAMETEDTALAMRAALELVDCCGSFDPTSASQYLALYQSCAVSQQLFSLLKLTQPDPSSSQLASLLEQNATLTARQPSLLPSTPPSLMANVDKLKGYEAWRRLEVEGNHLELLKNFPSHFRFIVLQHSPNRSQLYSAYMIPLQPPPAAPKKGQPTPQVVPLEPVVSCVSVSRAALDSLLELSEDYKESIEQSLLKAQLSQAPMGSSGGQALIPGNQSLLSDLLAAMEAYLSGALDMVGQALRKEGMDKDLTMVLLADSALLSLPLESLRVLQLEAVSSVSRDFSLQMLCHRMAKFTSDEGEKSTTRGSEKFHPRPASLLGNVANFRYILDPRNDLKPPGADEGPGLKVMTQFQEFSKLTAKWSGLVGQDHTVSVGEWAPLLEECSGLLFFGSERCLAHFPPQMLTPVNMKECSIVVLMDQMQTTSSALLQSKADMDKSTSELELEHPLKAVMLLSLVGVGCVLANQWSTTVEANTQRMNSLIKGLLSGSNTVGSVCPNSHKLKAGKATAHGDIQEGGGNKDQPDGWTSIEDTCNCVVYGLPHITLVSQ